MKKALIGVSLLAAGLAVALVVVLTQQNVERAKPPRRPRGAAKMVDAQRKQLEKLERAQKEIIVNVKDSHRRTEGHLLTQVSQIASGPEDTQTTFVKPVSGEESFTCTGVIGIGAVRHRKEFGQWVFSMPSAWSQAYLEVPDGKLYHPNRFRLDGTPSVITAELCPVMNKDGYADGVEWVLWLSAGHYIDGERRVIPVGKIPSKSKEVFVIEDSIGKSQTLPKEGELTLCTVLKKPSRDAETGTIVKAVKIMIEK